jgi:hypothetical protein
VGEAETAPTEAEHILCDTSFVSVVELAAAQPDIVAHWSNEVRQRVDAAVLAITVFVIGEVRSGRLRAGWSAAKIASAEKAMSVHLRRSARTRARGSASLRWKGRDGGDTAALLHALGSARRIQPVRGLRCGDWPTETFMVTSELWAQARGGRRCLCVVCLEERIDRLLEPADFPPLPLNDDHEVDTVRLRIRKGSGRRTEELYGLAQHAVLDLGIDLDQAATTLGLDRALLGVWVDGRRINREIDIDHRETN